MEHGNFVVDLANRVGIGVNVAADKQMEENEETRKGEIRKGPGRSK